MPGLDMNAWRRPLENSEVARLVTLASDAVKLGETPEAAIKQVVKTLLASPQFLYRIEFDTNLQGLPWKFRALEGTTEIHPGAVVQAMLDFQSGKFGTLED